MLGAALAGLKGRFRQTAPPSEAPVETTSVGLWSRWS